MPFAGFGLAAEDYWSRPLHGQSEWSLRLTKDDHTGILLDAPERVDPTRRQSLPLVVAWGASLLEAAQAPFEEHALIAAVDLAANRLFAGPATEVERALSAAPDPNARLPRGHMVSFQLLDARERLGLPWSPGAWLLRVILREGVSNPRRVELEGPAPVEASAPLEPWPPAGAPLPDYARRPDSPPVPEAGLALAVERVTPLRDGAQVVLRGSFRLPAQPHELQPDASSGSPRAVIAVSLLLPSSSGGPAAVRRLQVPCADAPDDDGRYAGWFALDILPGLARRTHTVFVHAFAGEYHTGPALAALVAADDLPEGS